MWYDLIGEVVDKDFEGVGFGFGCEINVWVIKYEVVDFFDGVLIMWVSCQSDDLIVFYGVVENEEL